MLENVREDRAPGARYEELRGGTMVVACSGSFKIHLVFVAIFHNANSIDICCNICAMQLVTGNGCLTFILLCWLIREGQTAHMA